MPSGTSSTYVANVHTITGTLSNSGSITVATVQDVTLTDNSRSLLPLQVSPEAGANVLYITNNRTGKTTKLEIDDCNITLTYEPKEELTPSEAYERAMKIIG